MAGFIKKRRKPGPSKNEQKIRRNENEARLEAMPLSATFPQLKGLSGELSFIYPPGNVLDSVKLQAAGHEHVKLSFDCPGRCGSGRFRLELKVSSAIAQSRWRLDIAEACPERSMGVDACGCELKGFLELQAIPPAPTT